MKKLILALTMAMSMQATADDVMVEHGEDGKTVVGVVIVLGENNAMISCYRGNSGRMELPDTGDAVDELEIEGWKRIDSNMIQFTHKGKDYMVPMSSCIIYDAE